MSMNPVIVGTDSSSPGGHAQYDPPSNISRCEQVQPEPNSGMEQKREKKAAEDSQNPSALGQDAVQVQREAGDQIVIRYLDRTGQMILQVPSAQLLGLQRAIAQALEEREQSRQMADSDGARNPGGAANGH